MTTTIRRTYLRGTDRKLAAMAALPCFAGCSATTLLRLGSLFDSAWVPAGALIGQTSAGSAWLYVVLEGEAVTTADGAPVLLGPGQSWGEGGFVADAGTPRRVVALTPLSLLVLSRAASNSVARCAPQVTAALRAAPLPTPPESVPCSLVTSALVRLALAS